MRIRSTRQGRRYAAIPNAALRDTRVSMVARGVLALLMTYSDSWVFQKAQLMAVSGLGRDKFESVMRELQDAGYVTLEAVRGARGRLEGTRWFILDDPGDTAAAAADEVSHDNSELSGESLSDAAAEHPANDRSHRGPENPCLGEAHRGPETPGPGKSGCIRRPTSKNTNKNPLTPIGDRSPVRAGPADRRPAPAAEDPPKPPSADTAPDRPDPDELIRLHAESIRGGRYLAPSALNPRQARRMVELGLATAAQLSERGVAL